MSGLKIRLATPDDTALILSFIHELAAFERAPDQVKATEEDLRRDGFGETPRFRCHLAEVDDVPAGFALYCYNYSTWEGRAGIHLEDLYVREAFRRGGVGKALLLSVVKTALQDGCTRLNWNVLHWNQPAIDFYQGLAAVILDEWRICRLTESSMQALADRSDLSFDLLERSELAYGRSIEML